MPPRPLDALRRRDFRWFWLASLVSNTGGWMQNATIPYVVFELTGRPGEVGLAGFFQYVPFMLMGVFGGALADRFPRRLLLLWAQVLQALVALALWWVVASGSATTASVAGLAFVAGLLGGLQTPVWQALVAELVPRDLLVGAVTLNSTQFNASRALGPFLAGVVIALWGPADAFLLNAISFGTVVVVLAAIRVHSDARGRPERVGLWSGVGEAARHLWATPALVACCVAIAAVAGLGSPLFSYLPVYGAEEYSVSGWQLGLLLGAGGIGAVVVAPALLNLQHRVRRAALLGVSMTIYGLAVAAVGLVRSYPAAVIALLFFGGAYLSIAATLNSTIQLVVREDLRGTVIALYVMCLTGALPIGLFVWGAAADTFGLRPTTVAAGLLLVAATGVFVATGRFTVMAVADRARDVAAGTAGAPEPPTVA